MMDFGLSCVLLIYLLPAVFARAWIMQPVPNSHSTVSLPLDFTKCIEVDLLQIEELRKRLNNELPVEDMTNKNSFGLREEDWLRLELLECRLPEGSLLKKKLLHVFRILVAALYEAHGTSLDRLDFGKVTPPINQSINLTTENTKSIETLEDLDTIDLTYNFFTDIPSPHSANHSKTTFRDPKDNEFAGSDVIEKVIPYQTTTPSEDQQSIEIKSDNYSTSTLVLKKSNNETDKAGLQTEHTERNTVTDTDLDVSPNPSNPSSTFQDYYPPSTKDIAETSSTIYRSQNDTANRNKPFSDSAANIIIFDSDILMSSSENNYENLNLTTHPPISVDLYNPVGYDTFNMTTPASAETPTSTEGKYSGENKPEGLQSTSSAAVNLDTTSHDPKSLINTSSLENQNLPTTKHTDSELISGNAVTATTASAATHTLDNSLLNKTTLEDVEISHDDNKTGVPKTDFKPEVDIGTRDISRSTVYLPKKPEATSSKPVSITNVNRSDKIQNHVQTASFNPTVTFMPTTKTRSEENISKNTSPTLKLNDSKEPFPFKPFQAISTSSFEESTSLPSVFISSTKSPFKETESEKIKNETNSEILLQTKDDSDDVDSPSTFTSTIKSFDETKLKMSSSSETKVDSRIEVLATTPGYVKRSTTDDVFNTPSSDENARGFNTSSDKTISVYLPSTTSPRNRMNNTYETTKDSSESQGEQERTMDEFSKKEKIPTTTNKPQNISRTFIVSFPKHVKRPLQKQPSRVPTLEIFKAKDIPFVFYQPTSKETCGNSNKCVRVQHIAYWVAGEAKDLGFRRHISEPRSTSQRQKLVAATSTLDGGPVLDDIDPERTASDDEIHSWNSKISTMRKKKTVNR